MDLSSDYLVYLDHAATTPLDERVFSMMARVFRDSPGNPSSLHAAGTGARREIENARESVARLISASPEEIVFTSGGTESDNLAVLGLAASASPEKKHAVVSKVEHAAVRETAKYLQKTGFEVSWLDVDEFGRVDVSEFEAAIRDDTAFASVMWANNEVGTVQPVLELSEICAERGVAFHSDAVQAAGRVRIDVREVSVSTLALSAHKLYGPKGVGAIFVRGGVELEPTVFGGGQERGVRSGTENVAGIAGFGEAAKLAVGEFEERVKVETELRDRVISSAKELPGVSLNGHPKLRLSNNVHLSVDGAESESLVLMLDALGYAVGKGSACSSSGHKASPVLSAMGQGESEAFSAVRVSPGKDNTLEEIDGFLRAFAESSKRLRELSPLTQH